MLFVGKVRFFFFFYIYTYIIDIFYLLVVNCCCCLVCPQLPRAAGPPFTCARPDPPAHADLGGWWPAAAKKPKKIFFFQILCLIFGEGRGGNS